MPQQYRVVVDVPSVGWHITCGKDIGLELSLESVQCHLRSL